MQFKRKHIELAVYLAPPILAAWWQKSVYYKYGFVVRLLWLGFVLRIVGRSKCEAKKLLDQRYAYDDAMVNYFDVEFWK